ncbi:MAG: 50S ribosomal protein L11 methyltransferase [Burkholderiales bacterium]|nr:50S ribosomal protein L11 methyltransferase [Burkholderiales bacterium]
MAWQTVTLQLVEGEAEALSEALLDAGAISVAIEDAHAGTAREVPRYTEPAWDAPAAWGQNRLEVLLPADADATRILQEAARSAGIGALPVLAFASIDDADWVQRCEAQFAPLAIGARLRVVPSWHATPADPGCVVIRVDPGLAFGTGSHPSTRLMLAWLEQVMSQIRTPAPRVLDYGCGSGILAIAAGKLGAATVDAVDTDPQAIAVTLDTARRNGVALRALAPDALPDGEYDIVLANILANPLIMLAPRLAARVLRGGRIALAGLLESQATQVIGAYRAAFDARVAATEDGWALLDGVRR